MYARQGLELMGLQSPVSLPVLGFESNMNYQPKASRYREVGLKQAGMQVSALDSELVS